MTSVEWIEGKVVFIDQTKLPTQEVYVETTDPEVITEAIRSLRVRGAPAIGVAAGFALCLAVVHGNATTIDHLRTRFSLASEALSRSRPTAVNLFVTLERMQRVFDSSSSVSIESLRARLLAEALSIQREDKEACRLIGELGARLIERGSTVLTHCNTGALATAGSGTAQSIITTAAQQGKIRRVFVDETRPLLQGARLTAWELCKFGIDVTLITDSTAGFLMQRSEVNAVIVGADRIAANGDTANKIGTYSLAVLAHHHGVPFYVAAPVTTIDIDTPSGESIKVEERDPGEVTCIGGTRIAADGVQVYAPAFDVTPNGLITAIVTDRGVLDPPFGPAITDLFRVG